MGGTAFEYPTHTCHTSSRDTVHAKLQRLGAETLAMKTLDEKDVRIPERKSLHQAARYVTDGQQHVRIVRTSV
jgi:hypothetical protein